MHNGKLCYREPFPSLMKMWQGLQPSGQSYKALYDCNLQTYNRTDYKIAHIMTLSRVIIYTRKMFIRLAAERRVI